MSEQRQSIRVIIVDDDPFVRTSLSTILSAQTDIEVCASGGDGAEAVALFEEHAPDVLLMDIQMPGTDGLTAAQTILAVHPTANIVFLTTFSDDEYIVSALRMGAKGYLIKQEVANIAPALRSVVSGQSVLGGEIVGRMDSLMNGAGPTATGVASDGAGMQGGDGSGADAPEAGAARHRAATHAGLSDREFEIVELIAQGFDNKQIAESIFISEGTVRNHVSSMLQKLNLKNRTQLAVFYYRELG